jgi:hypothetical protein
MDFGPTHTLYDFAMENHGGPPYRSPIIPRSDEFSTVVSSFVAFVVIEVFW